MLELSEISVSFGGVQVLKDVDLRVPEGGITGLIGPNGAGKTTLFNVATGMQRPDHGRVRFADRDISRMAPYRRARLGLIRTFQRLEIFESLTVRENMLVAADAVRRPGPRPDIDSILARVGLAEAAGRQADLLSTGQARLLEIARGLAAQPRLLLLDEPGSGLDDRESKVLGKLLLSLADEGIAIFLVEHDVELVMRVCQQIHVLDFGQLLAHGTAAPVRSNPLVRKAYLGELDEPAEPAPVGDRSGTRPGVTSGGSGEVARPAAVGMSLVPRPEPPKASGILQAAAEPPPAIELADVRVAYGRIEVLHGV